MKIVLKFIILMLATIGFGQAVYKGKVVDIISERPIPFVNIGILDKGIGTVSDENGIFYLEFDEDELSANSILQFSSLGYKKIEMNLSNAKYLLEELSIIEMHPSDIILDEVVVSDVSLVSVTDYIGYRNNGQKIFGYWKENKALGAELSTKIKVGKGKRQLDNLEFEVWENELDSLLLRINFYDNDGILGRPKTNLNTSQKNILYTLKNGVSVVKIDLTPFDIFVKDDFFVSLELLKLYGDQELALVLAASESD